MRPARPAWAALLAMLVPVAGLLAVAPLAALGASPAPVPSSSPVVAASAADTGLGALTPVDNQSHLYTLDGWGGLHPAGSSPALSSPDYFGWDIARALAVYPDGSGGYVLDGFGGLHALGTAAPIHAGDYFGWDIARAVALAPWASPSRPAGWVLDGWGGIHPFGGAPGVVGAGYWPGWDIARALVITGDSNLRSVSGYQVDGFGGMHALGVSPPASGGYFGFDIARGLSLSPGSTELHPSGYLLDGWGGIHPFGGAPPVAATAYFGGSDVVRSLTTWSAAPAGTGAGWVLAGTGELYRFGSAPQVGSNASYGWDIARSAAGAGAGSGGRGRLTSRTLSVPYYRQTHRLDCEAAALQMALGYFNLPSTQDQILGIIGADTRPAQVDYYGNLVAWGDPYATFVGSVNGSEVDYTGYGVYYPPLAVAAQQLGAKVNQAHEGIDPATIYAAVLDGHPVIAWVGNAQKGLAPGPATYYTAFDGQRVIFGHGFEHAVTVAGVTPTSVLVNNPLSSPTWMSRSDFEAAYASFNHMAVILG